MAKNENLTDEQWAILDPLIAEPKRRDDGRARPWRENREVADGILWILRTGARWQDLPDRFPPYQTCRRRFQMWVRNGTLKSIPGNTCRRFENTRRVGPAGCEINRARR